MSFQEFCNKCKEIARKHGFEPDSEYLRVSIDYCTYGNSINFEVTFGLKHQSTGLTTARGSNVNVTIEIFDILMRQRVLLANQTPETGEMEVPNV